MTLRVTFRVDASLSIGHGHVMRCLTLAKALQDHGALVTFVSREYAGHLFDLIEASGIEVARLPCEDRSSEHAPESLDSRWFDDAHATLVLLKEQPAKPDWLVVDSYAYDARWERIIRPFVGRVLVIDDMANRPHECDVLLDQNLVAGFQGRYLGLVPETCETLLGPEYALLQPDYARLRDQTETRAGDIKRILISFGGADLSNVTGRALAAFLSLERPDIEVHVVVPAASLHLREIRTVSAVHPNVRVSSGHLSLASLMAASDLAIGAGGATSWERLCLGLPTVMITLAENQLAVASELARRGLVRSIGASSAIGDQVIVDCLAALTSEPLDPSWSARCRSEVDGKGVDRVLKQVFRS